MAATDPVAAEPDEPAHAGRGRPSVRVLLLLGLIALLVYGLDQLSKLLVVENLELGEVVPLLGEILQLRYVTNPGAAFSLASGFTWVLSIVALGVTGFIVWFAPRIRSLGWATMFGLVLGGAFGNVTDRLTREPGFGVGHVVDFIQVIHFPAIFNVADIAIVSSMGLFVLLSLRGVGLDGRRVPSEPKRDRTAKAKSPVTPDEAPTP